MLRTSADGRGRDRNRPGGTTRVPGGRIQLDPTVAQATSQRRDALARARGAR